MSYKINLSDGWYGRGVVEDVSLSATVNRGEYKDLQIKIDDLRSQLISLESRLNSAFNKIEEQSKTIQYFIDMVEEGEINVK